jgi:hypothetical protein
VGGLPEAKQGVDYLLPVQPISHYQREIDDRLHPIAVVPPQDVGPWVTALRRLTEDRVHYDHLALASRVAALRYIDGVGVEPFEQLFAACS